jgi:hypothetical protein
MQTFFVSLGSWKLLAAIALADQICSAAGQPVSLAAPPANLWPKPISAPIKVLG